MKPAPIFLVLAMASVLGAQVPPSPGGEPAFRVSIATADPSGLRATLEGLGYDVSCLPVGPAAFEAVVSVAEHAALAAAGVVPAVIETAQPLRQRLSGVEDVFPGYHDLAAINAFLAATEASLPGLAKVVDLAAVYGPGATVEGRPINALKISDNAPLDEDEPAVLFVACHHCREIITPELALDIIGRLTSGYGSDPQITSFVDANEIWVIPVQNPDGLEHTWNVNNLWRKNRRDLGGGVFGVDLNRNYPLGWNGSCAGSTQPGSDVYKGPAPASENETQTLIAFARDRRFAKVMDFHSYGREVLMGYLCSAFPPVLDAQIDAGAAALAAPAGYGTREPSAEGEEQQWQIQEITDFAYLVETGVEFQPPYATAQAEANLVWPTAVQFLGQDIPVTGRVTSATTGLPLAADVAIGGVAFSNGETRRSRLLTGRFHLWLPAASWQLTFSAPGHVARTLTAAVAATGTTTLDVALVPAAPIFTLQMTTLGGGAGDLHLALSNVPGGSTEGFTLFSLAATQQFGSGILFGLEPDALTLACLLSPGVPGNIFHWAAPFTPAVFPALPFDLPPGTLLFPAGTTVDGVAVSFVAATYAITGVTNLARIVF